MKRSTGGQKKPFLKHYWLLMLTLAMIGIICLSHGNQWLFLKINAGHGYVPEAVWNAINGLSYARFFVLAILLLLITYRWRRERLANVIFVVLAYYVVFMVLKHMVAEPRPYISLAPQHFYWLNHYEDALKSAHLSFPSGHVGNMAVFVFSLITLFFQKKPLPRVLLLALLILTMFARICTGWHWPLDVLVSAVIGFVLVKIAFAWRLA